MSTEAMGSNSRLNRTEGRMSLPYAVKDREHEIPVFDMKELDSAADYAMAAWRAKRTLDRKASRRARS